MAQPRPQHSHLPLNSRARSRILRHPRTASSKNDRNQKQCGENKLFREEKKNLTKSILPTRNTRASRLKEQEAINIEHSQKKMPNARSWEHNSTRDCRTDRAGDEKLKGREKSYNTRPRPHIHIVTAEENKGDGSQDLRRNTSKMNRRELRSPNVPCTLDEQRYLQGSIVVTFQDSGEKKNVRRQRRKGKMITPDSRQERELT